MPVTLPYALNAACVEVGRSDALFAPKGTASSIISTVRSRLVDLRFEVFPRERQNVAKR